MSELFENNQRKVKWVGEPIQAKVFKPLEQFDSVEDYTQWCLDNESELVDKYKFKPSSDGRVPGASPMATLINAGDGKVQLNVASLETINPGDTGTIRSGKSTTVRTRTGNAPATVNSVFVRDDGVSVQLPKRDGADDTSVYALAETTSAGAVAVVAKPMGMTKRPNPSVFPSKTRKNKK